MTETSPTAQRREVGTLLRAHRERVGLMLAEAADQAGMSAAKLSRLERGLRGLQINDVRTLCGLYGLSDSETRNLVSATRSSREPGWWSSYSELGATAPTFFGLESAADSVSNYGGMCISGLLQTPAYATSVLRSARPVGLLSEEAIQERVAARMKRASLMLPRPDRTFNFILDEAALRRCVGSPETMREQVRSILEVGVESNVRIQVIPFSAGSHPAIDTAFTLQEFERSGQRDVVFVEHLAGVLILEQAEQVSLYRAALSELSAKALSLEDSRSFLSRAEGFWLKEA